jgi:hypothetical protein
MSDDDVDPRWPPPVAEPSEDVDPNWPPPPMDPADDIDPNWAPPQGQPSRPSSTQPWASDSFTAPVFTPATPARGAQRGSRGWLLALVAGIVGIAVGILIALVVVHRSASTPGAQGIQSTSSGVASSPQVGTTAAAISPPTASAPTAAATSVPNAGKFVYLRTVSGKTRCLVQPDQVTCETSGFPQAPVDQSGLHFDDAVVTAAGNFQWQEANIGGGGQPNDFTLNYQQTYTALGWTIVAAENGTRFTKDGTGHGMFVSIDDVNSF